MAGAAGTSVPVPLLPITESVDVVDTCIIQAEVEGDLFVPLSCTRSPRWTARCHSELQRRRRSVDEFNGWCVRNECTLMLDDEEIQGAFLETWLDLEWYSRCRWRFETREMGYGLCTMEDHEIQQRYAFAKRAIMYERCSSSSPTYHNSIIAGMSPEDFVDYQAELHSMVARFLEQDIQREARWIRSGASHDSHGAQRIAMQIHERLRSIRDRWSSNVDNDSSDGMSVDLSNVSDDDGMTIPDADPDPGSPQQQQ